MKSLTTRVGAYVTGDALADAVMSYSLALARLRRVDVVDIPFRTDSGAFSNAQFTIGWMADVDSVSIGHLDPELTDGTVIADLYAREDALRSHGDVRMSADDFRPSDGFDEY